ncbi:MAG: copper amine oxidase N-terminal domain-containing protein [Bacillota bacterium]|nr:copper amine oxidase N-terminal domain-containing protein [Bacillota bacterium]
MKRILSIIITAALVFSGIGAMAEGTDSINITFKVGESVLSINGIDTKVETPYVVDGTTLVPLRVITEAFGAEVAWEDSTQTITLTYPGVTIQMQIGSNGAQINSHTENMTIAPVLSAGGVTMVPLRFISETFGAEVTYDNVTEKITVTKDKINEQNTVTGVTEMSRIGDSYYGWSMNTPSELFMEDRSFDGLHTTFVDENKNLLTIDFYSMDKDLSFEKDFSNIKDSFQGYILIKADKLTDKHGNQCMHFQAKDKTTFIDYTCYYENNMIFDITVKADPNAENLSDLIDTAASFELAFGDKSATYDLSNVSPEGYRTFSDERYKISFTLPADWEQVSADEENNFLFWKHDPKSKDHVNLEIYSKSSNLTAEILANKDYESNIKNRNKELCESSGVAVYQVNDKIKGYAYKIITSGSRNDDGVLSDIFFEVGEYVYNIAFYTENDERGMINKLLSTLKADTINANEVGVLIRNDYEDDTTYVSKIGKCTLTLPMLWVENNLSSTGCTYYHKITDNVLGMEIFEDSGATAETVKEFVEQRIKEISRSSDKKIVQDSMSKRMGKITYYYYIYSMVYEDKLSYFTEFIGISGKKIYTFKLTQSEITYDSAINDEVTGIINSLTV